jgi:predicted enzyme related to lactoylglutathione lyase
MADHGKYSHIEIPADDPVRATAFYEGVFGWQFVGATGFPDYYLYSPEQAGVGGAIGRRGVTAARAIRNYISVDSIDESLPMVSQHGGRIVAPKAEVPGQGWYAVVTDSEGNEFALWEQHADARPQG